ncbi:tRNA-uridine aminocarboxypropyltransferase 2 [Halotydeus destructor]|nr:tRNA-uridine aminocarboxypropyltransferase 2 [Halotydeus destructor]
MSIETIDLNGGVSDEEGKGNVHEEMLRMAAVPAEPPNTRQLCDQCCRPKVVCWCHSLPQNLKMKCKLFILQHPMEEKRCLRTARILELGCPPGHCDVIKGKRFSASRFPVLKDLLADKKTLLLFPSTNAVQLDDVPPNEEYNVLLLDGTWSQARSMYFNSPELHDVQKVELNVGRPSCYVIRTQPNDNCLSTVETAALALAHLENQPSLYQELTKPLNTLCSFQLEYGAVHHFSKEYLIVNGMYDKPVTRKMRKKIGKMRESKTIDKLVELN